jgi:2-isopropylmalate synthase
MAGLEVEVMLDGEVRELASPASLFIPAGALHSYRVLGGSGYYVNHVLHGEYNDSLLEPEPLAAGAAEQERAKSAGSRYGSQIRSFLAARAGLAPGCLTEHLDLIEAGVLDSLGLLELFAFLEELTGARLEGNQMNVDAVRTIRSICENFASGSFEDESVRAFPGGNGASPAVGVWPARSDFAGGAVSGEAVS